MKFYIYNLGCKVNSYESNIMKEDLIKNGFNEGTLEDSDIYIINTCTVTNTSDNKSLKTVRKYLRLNKIVVVTGCMSQIRFKELINMNVAIILGNYGKSKISSYIKDYLKNKKQIIDIKDINDFAFEDMCLNNFNKTRAFVKIEDGCENFCSYCIIPYARGKVRSKDKDLVIKEITNLVENGHKEIVLTGIHTGHYKMNNNYNFANLLEDILKIKGLERLRISSIEITEVTDDIIKLIKENKLLAAHMHIPLQSGSNNTLKDMNRKYDKEYFINKIKKIKEARKDISITTDVIVGFPSETKEDFEETKETIDKIGFSKLHVFPFSLRKGTKAEEFENIVSDVEKKRRVHELIEKSRTLEEEYMNKFIGKDVSVIPEIYKDGYLIGHSSNYLNVKFKGEPKLIGELVDVKILKSNYPLMEGEIKNV